MSRKKSGRLENEQKFGSSKIVQYIQQGRAENESLKLQTVLPEELWALVFNKLKDHQDVANTSNSSLYFRTILLSKRTLFLFPQVWSILGKMYESSKDAVYQESTEVPRLSYYGLSNRLFSGILKLRLVSQTWCNGIDNFYQNLEEHYTMWHDSNKPVVSCKKEICENNIHQFGCWTRIYDLQNMNRPAEFANYFRNTHAGKRNPIISNAVKVAFYEFPDQITGLKKFLAVYGQYIWHCELVLTRREWSLGNTYKALKTGLAKMPNLRSLRIMYERVEGNDNDNSPKELHSLTSRIGQDPLPVLEHLKFLESFQLPAPILNELVQRNSGLTSIEIHHVQTLCNIFSQKDLNVSQISLEVHSQAEFDQLQAVNWKLTKIYLDFSECSYIPWSQIFRLLEDKWGETAGEVMLHLPSSQTEFQIRSHIQEHGLLRLNLPHVHRLGLVLENICSIDFVLPMKYQLKQLEVSEAYKGMEKSKRKLWENEEFAKVIKNKVINFQGLQCGNQNNIWEVFPNLQYFEYNNSESYKIKGI